MYIICGCRKKRLYLIQLHISELPILIYFYDNDKWAEYNSQVYDICIFMYTNHNSWIIFKISAMCR